MTSPVTPEDGQRFRLIKDNKLLWGAALALGLALFFVFLNHQGLFDIYRFRKEKTHLDQEIAKLTAENDRLARTIDRLQHDPQMVQDLIRRELNFVKKNEIIFQLPPETGAAPLPPPVPQAGPAADIQAKPGSFAKGSVKGAAKAAPEGASRGAGRERESTGPRETAAGPKAKAAATPR